MCQPSATHERRTARVIVAASQAGDLHAIAELLARDDYEVTTALDALECLERLHAVRPRVLVMEDRILWGASKHVSARLHNDLREMALPVIVIDDPSSSAITMATPVTAHLQKPVEPGDLLDALRHATSLS